MAGSIVKLPQEEPEQPAIYVEIAAAFALEPSSMSREELEALLPKLEAWRGELDAMEPKKKRSDAYEDWAELHEYLEDLIDETLDALDG